MKTVGARFFLFIKVLHIQENRISITDSLTVASILYIIIFIKKIDQDVIISY